MTCYHCARRRPLFYGFSEWAEAGFAWLMVIILLHVTPLPEWKFVFTVFFVLQLGTAILNTIFAIILTLGLLLGIDADDPLTEPTSQQVQR